MKRADRERLERCDGPDRFDRTLAGLVGGPSGDGNGGLLAPAETLEAWRQKRELEAIRHEQIARTIQDVLDLGRNGADAGEQPKPTLAPRPKRPDVRARLAARRLPPEVAPPQDGQHASWRVSLRKVGNVTTWIVDGEEFLQLIRAEGRPSGINQGDAATWARVPWRLEQIVKVKAKDYATDIVAEHLAAYPRRDEALADAIDLVLLKLEETPALPAPRGEPSES